MPTSSPDRRFRSRAVEVIARAADRLSRTSPPRSAIDPSRVRRILVVKPCCLGDVLMATAALRALNHHFPDAHIEVLTTDWCADVLKGNDDIDGTISYPEHPSALRLLRLAQRLAQEKFDIGISLDRSPRVNGLLLLARIPERAGIDSMGRGVGLTRRTAPKPLQHETELFLSVLATLGVEPQGVEPEFHPSEVARAHAKKLLGEARRPVVVVHPGGAVNPGSVMLSKRWPAILFGELASRLVDTEGASIVLVGALSDREAVQITADFTDAPVLDLGGQLSIDELGAVCEAADLYVGNDSGITHLASAVGTPTVTIFGPTSPYQYRPLGPNGHVCAPAASWNPDLVGVDLRGRRPPVDPSADVREVSVAEVLETCRAALASPTSSCS